MIGALFKFLLFLGLVGLLGLTGFAYFGDLAPPPVQNSLTVMLDAK